MKTYRLITILLITLVLSVSNAYALNFGANITIADGENGYYGSGTGTSQGNEDQEVSPNCIQGQAWDLEGFFLKDRLLTVVGGYDFINGKDGWTSGDIFIGKTGNVKYGPGTGGGYNNSPVQNIFGYDYVIVLDWVNNESQLKEINSDSYVMSVYYAQNESANAWKDDNRSVASAPITYYGQLFDADVGFRGDPVGARLGTHNAFTVDLEFLPAGDYTFHYTYGCGNDNLMGRAEVPPQVPEPGSLLLLGLGLLGVGILRRKQ